MTINTYLQNNIRIKITFLLMFNFWILLKHASDLSNEILNKFVLN